jgi:hypothetical protein
MKKEQTLERLNSIERETVELRKIISSFEEPKNIIERVRTFEDAFNIVKAKENLPEWISDIVKVKSFNDVPNWLRVFVVNNALNEGWQPDWSNSNEYKYYPWFSNFVSGSGFSFYVYGYHDSHYSGTSIGSRLCFKTEELAQYAGKQFTDIYNFYLSF